MKKLIKINISLRWLYRYALIISLISANIIFFCWVERRMNRANKDMKELKVEMKETYNHINSFYYLLNQVPLGSPLDSIEITSMYGWREKKEHKGIDLKGTYRDTVYVTGEGIVKKAGWMYGYGKCIVIDHLNGYTTIYAHLRKIFVEKNETVYKKQAIGIVGSTGFSTGTHLHYEIKHLGNSKDPYYFIMFDKKTKPKQR